MDVAAQRRLWAVRESVAEILGIHGPPLKFDVSLPLSEIEPFAAAADDATASAAHAPDAIPVLFGHVGEGNLHLNLVRCALGRRSRAGAVRGDDGADRTHHGNVSSEHGVGSRKRDYLSMSRTEADIDGHARGEGRVRPGRLPQSGGAVRLSRSRASRP